MNAQESPTIQLESWSGPWDDDDPHGNFKAEVALWSKADPMETLEPFSEVVGIPVGAVCRSVLARWAGEGSAGKLELGPTMVERLWAVCEEAGDDSTKQQAAFDQLRQMLSWLRAPLEVTAPIDPRASWELPRLGELPISASLTETVTHVVAPNTSHMTLDGTNTYVVGEPGSGAAFVVDPGPADAAHFDRVRAVLQGLDAECSGVVVTHHHLDHSEAALAWGATLGAPVAASSGEVAGPDGWVLGDGDVLAAGGTTLTAVPTPGHSADHLCFRLDDGSLLSGDHVLGRGTTVVAWPEGDLAAYLDSLRRVLDLGPDALFPGHGPELLEDPGSVISFYLEHRAWREGQVRAALADDESLAARPADLVTRLYADVDPVLWPAAELSTRACLVKLAAEGVVSRLPFDSPGPDRSGGDARHPLG